MAATIERLVTSGTFSLGDDTFGVENNVWIIGDAEEAMVIDAAHDADIIAAAVGSRRLLAILCTHAHNDHIDAAPALSDRTGAPILLNRKDLDLWHRTHPDRVPDDEADDGRQLHVAGSRMTVRHTPGHSPGSVSVYDPALGTVFTGDTLFCGGPGATGHPFSDFGTIIDSIRERLLTLPPETAVCPGHGDTTTVGEEAKHQDEWLDRGY
ncbi:MBL fold metallo-hydrolase [Wenjunlia tyrosinilytica]|nr:MBL fold metallo-hydrolase [Wenjunlia tyrosinilytica]